MSRMRSVAAASSDGEAGCSPPDARGCAGVHAVRAAVLHRGWQDRGVLGTALRRVDRHLP